MRALITGATGFVGSHLIDYLIEHTHWNIFGMTRWRSPLDNIAHHIGRINAGDRLHLLTGDLRDENSLREVVKAAKPKFVFHLAAQSYPKTSFDAPCDTLDTNVQGTVKLLQALRDHAPEAAIHVCSSSEVYGRVPAELLPITESCPFHPASPYAISKVGTDLIARHYAEAYKMKIIVTRMFTHTGPRRGDVFAESSFAKQVAMIEAGMLLGPVRVGNLRSMRTIADVRDAVRAYHMLLTVNPQWGQVYNIGGEHSCPVGNILGFLLDLAGMKNIHEVDQMRLRPIDADNQIPDCTKFKEHTGWKPEITFQQTMTDLLEYWRLRVKTTTPLQR